MDLIGPATGLGLFVSCLVVLAIVVGPLILAAVLINRSAREQAAPAPAPLLALLQDQLAEDTTTDDPGGRQAVADAAACLDLARRFAPSSPNTYRGQQVGLLCAHGLDFLRPWRDIVAPEGSTIPAVPASAAAGRITALHQGRGAEPLIASPERTDATPYYHPGGGIAGIPIPTGWYSRAWWAESLRSGQQTPQLLSGWQALFGPGTDPAMYHSGLGDTTQLGALWGIWLNLAPTRQPIAPAAGAAAAAAGSSTPTTPGGIGAV